MSLNYSSRLFINGIVGSLRLLISRYFVLDEDETGVGNVRIMGATIFSDFGGEGQRDRVFLGNYVPGTWGGAGYGVTWVKASNFLRDFLCRFIRALGEVVE